jgi:hypothetical protein
MKESFDVFRVTELPNKELDTVAFFETIGKNAFLLIYDLDQRATFLCIDASIAEGKIKDIMQLIPGIRFETTEYAALDFVTDIKVLSCYKRPDKFEKLDVHHMRDIFDLALGNGFIAVAFIPASEKELDHAKSYVERVLSRKEVRETHSAMTEAFSKRASSSTQRDLFMESEETALLNSILVSINNAILSNNLTYKQFFIAPKAGTALQEYIATRFMLLNESECRSSLAEQLGSLPREKSFPLGTDYLKNFVNFYGPCKLNYVLPTISQSTKEGIILGTSMKNGVAETNYAVRINPSTMNLGFIITGLPGSGKTKEAMAILDAVRARVDDAQILVIAPTEEWDRFAIAHGMYLIRPYVDKVPINLFRCPPTIQREKFYENLALVLASASNAGPYQNPLEQCLLNAFRRVYSETDTPNPISVYDAIEESIIRFHAKRTNIGIKYTKHGENIKSALENLRAILNKPEYSMSEGIRMEEIADKGIIFNVSGISSEKRPYLYALLLNQIYALAAGFDTDGDDELRLLICLEEAQTVFGNKESAAIQDLRQRIQDFRKQGIGLMLLAHTISDIEQGVRRLCQIKLYLKQAPDIAAVAAKDLIFTYACEDDVVLKLKILDSRIGALSYVLKNGDEKHTPDTTFIRTAEYVDKASLRTNLLDAYIRKIGLRVPTTIDTHLNIVFDIKGEASKLQQGIHYVRFRHLGEELATHVISGASIIVQALTEGSEYTLQFLDRRERIMGEFRIKACPTISLRIHAESIEIAGQS